MSTQAIVPTQFSPVSEALLTLIAELTLLLSEEWQGQGIDRVKARINAMIARSLRTAI